MQLLSWNRTSFLSNTQMRTALGVFFNTFIFAMHFVFIFSLYFLTKSHTTRKLDKYFCASLGEFSNQSENHVRSIWFHKIDWNLTVRPSVLTVSTNCVLANRRYSSTKRIKHFGYFNFLLHFKIQMLTAIGSLINYWRCIYINLPVSIINVLTIHNIAVAEPKQTQLFLSISLKTCHWN